MRQKFGPFFFDPALGRLISDGREIRLRPKTSEVLAVLLVRSPELVSHDELIESVWEGRSLSDAVLAQAVSELRGALGDDARNPLYIETMHRRGYRFIHTLEPIEADRSPQEALASSEPARSQPDTRPRHGARLAVGLAGLPAGLLVVGLLLLATGGLLAASGHLMREQPAPTVLLPATRVAFVAVRPGVPEAGRWPEVLLEMTRNSLVSHPDSDARVMLPFDRISRLRRMRGELAVDLSQELAAQPRAQAELTAAASMLAADHLVLGSVSVDAASSATRTSHGVTREDGQFQVRLWRAPDGAELGSWTVSFIKNEQGSAKAAAQRVSNALSKALDWPAKRRRRVQLGAEPACWRGFIEATDATQRQDFSAAVDHLEHASALCPQSSDLRYLQASALEKLGRYGEAAAMARLALEAQGRDRWRSRVLERRLAGDLPGALRAGQRYLSQHPASGDARLVVAQLHLELGQPESAAETLEHRSIDTDPYLDHRREALLGRLSAE